MNGGVGSIELPLDFDFIDHDVRARLQTNTANDHPARLLKAPPSGSLEARSLRKDGVEVTTG
jgi:hypothetical protein